MQRCQRLSILLAALAALSAVFFAASASAFPVYQYSTQFGSRGTGNGQFEEPEGAAIDSAGNFWVADRGNVQKFNSKGEFLLKITKGIYNLGTPKDVAVTSAGNIWVTDANGQRVVEFSTNGTYIREFGGKYGSGKGEFEFPNSIAIDSSGNLWVVDHAHVQEFNSEGTFIRKFGSEGTGNGQFSYITGIAIDAENNVWVADDNPATETTRIEEFNSSGTYIKQIGAGVLGGTTSDVLSIHGGNLWVSDGSCYCIKVLDTNGTVQTQFGGPKASEGETIWTSGVAFDASGNPWVLNTSIAAIEKWVPAPPAAITQAASAVNSSEARLNSQINPEGSATTYQFEYGTTTSYGSKVPASPASAGSGVGYVTSNQFVSGLKPTTTYHYRVVATSAAGTTNGTDKTFTTTMSTAQQLEAMAVINPFDGGSTSLSNFGAKWGVPVWASGTYAKGEDSSTGWGPVEVFPAVAGAYYNEKETDTGSGIATVATMSVSPGTAERYFSVWLEMPTPGAARNGYELRLTYTGVNTYTVTLSKWLLGTQTVLASKTGFTFEAGNSLALVHKGGTLSAWFKTGSEFTSSLSATDSSLEGGKSGIGGSGNATRLTNFKTGSL